MDNGEQGKSATVQTSQEGQGQQTQPSNPTGQQNMQQNQQGVQQLPPIDYAKIQQMLDSTLAAKEDTTLKAYFKKQGLSQQEAEQAIASFMAEKAKNQPDPNALQTQLAQAQEEMKKAQVENTATITAIGMGMDAKTIPYLLKLADFSNAFLKDGKINEEAIKASLNKVLEEVPALKSQPGQATGFVQVGASGGQGQAGNGMEDALKKAFGL